MIHAGIDLHKRFSQVAAIDEETGEVWENRLPNDSKAVEMFFSSLPGPVVAAVESTFGWYWLVDALQEMGIEVVLSNPVQTKAICSAKVKNDKVDAMMLANLLEADILPACWIPPLENRRLREMLRFRAFLVRLRTRLKNSVRALLAKKNIHAPMDNIWGTEGRKWVVALPLDDPYKSIMDQSLSLMDRLSQFISSWESVLEEKGNGDERVNLLKSVPGIGVIHSMTIVAEAGDFSRFPSAKKFASYSCLVPTDRSSGGKVRHGPIGRQGNLILKYTFAEAATAAVRVKGPLRKYYLHQRSKKGTSVAKIALGRKMAKTVYQMIKHNLTFDQYVKAGFIAG
jgi:transposase